MAGHHDIHHEMALAREIMASRGEELRRSPELAGALDAYKREIAANWGLMAELGVVEVCSSCAGARAESCCFNGAERWYYRDLIVLNLLMGVRLPKARAVEHQCLFIGRDGCLLKARWSICINFFCPEMIAELGEDAIARLRRQAGREISAGMQAEAVLARLLRPA